MEHSHSNFLNVGDGHKIYWEDWGNKDCKVPIFHLHGGPGSCFNDSHKSLYDPKVHRVIFHDQRACGRSLSQSKLLANTTQHLLSDIEAIRKFLGVKELYLSGGSWGSTLALFYAIHYPAYVKKMLLWSIWLARECEEWAANEGFRSLYRPEEYQRFSSMIPKPKRKNSKLALSYFSEMISGPDLDTAFKYAYELSKWEEALSSSPAKGHAYNSLEDKKGLIAQCQVFLHYSLNKCFFTEGFILNNIHNIKKIPCKVAHGRFDLNTAPFSAHDLQVAYGSQLELFWVDSGHLRDDPPMKAKLQELALEFLS